MTIMKTYTLEELYILSKPLGQDLHKLNEQPDLSLMNYNESEHVGMHNQVHDMLLDLLIEANKEGFIVKTKTLSESEAFIDKFMEKHFK